MSAITFLGGAETVTGSRFLVDGGEGSVLVDCGLFQGLKTLRLRNREPFPVDPSEVGAVVLTHAHIDHSGYLPAFVRDGFRGTVWSTEVSQALCGILLSDSGKLQEEEAAGANRHGWSRHTPALPLYTVEDAHRALEHFQAWDFDRPFAPLVGFEAEFRQAGHIPGAAMVRLRAGGVTILFSGDVGRPDDPLLPAPAPPPEADVVVMESTYGARRHPPDSVAEHLAEVIRRTVGRGGSVIVPAFAVGRAQQLLYHLDHLLEEKAIPDIPVFLDSPMATKATRILFGDADAHILPKRHAYRVARVAEVAATVEDSRRITAMRIPRIIVSASGMATGGRVLHHLKALLPDPRNTVLLSGFQAAGTRGAHLRDGARQIKIHGEQVEVRAEVATMDGLSAHADADELLAWLRGIPAPPREVILVHGEPVAADTLRVRVEEELGFSCRVARHMERLEV